jgi:mannose-6-phosphate isomerase
VILAPARLDPEFSPRPWGALSLAPQFPEKSGLAEPIGEAWMTGNRCRFANGPFAGQELGKAWPNMALEWAGTGIDRRTDFPLLVKFLFTEDKLSVQVHPGDDEVARHEPAGRDRGKTEMWYALRARPGAEVSVGLKPHLTLPDFRRAISNGTAEECLTRVRVAAGDAIFVPAGTAHAIGPGLLLCEIQQNSDTTYRVYDYNRPDAQGQMRPLHIEQALRVMRFGPQAGGKIEPLSVERGNVTETYFGACRYFATEKWEFRAEVVEEASAAHFDLLIFIEGHGSISTGDQQVPYGPTEVWMIPAALGKYRLRAERPTSVLRTYAPEGMDEFAARLAARGVKESEISRLIYP